MGSGVKVIAHRGSSGLRSENTLSAFGLALEEGAQMIETDLRLTRDRFIVLSHDSYSPRGTSVELSTFSRLCEDFPRGDCRLLSLEEALDEFGGRIDFNLELKASSDEGNRLLAETAIREVSDRGLLSNILFSSFEMKILAKIRAESSDARLGVLLYENSASGLRDTIGLRPESIHPSKRRVSLTQIEAWHSEGLLVNAYTVDHPREIEKMWSMGVDGIFTNYPARAVTLIHGFDALT